MVTKVPLARAQRKYGTPCAATAAGLLGRYCCKIMTLWNFSSPGQIVGPALAGVLMNGHIDLEARYCARNYHPLPVVLTRGEGVHVFDDTGRKYLDMMSAYSAVSHGHAHPRLVRVVQEQVERLNIVSRAFHTDKLGPFLQRACDLTAQDMALPMNTGAEAVETAIKAARKWAYTIKGVAEDKAEIITCTGNFHGRTIAIVAMSDEPQTWAPLPRVSTTGSG